MLRVVAVFVTIAASAIGILTPLCLVLRDGRFGTTVSGWFLCEWSLSTAIGIGFGTLALRHNNPDTPWNPPSSLTSASVCHVQSTFFRVLRALSAGTIMGVALCHTLPDSVEGWCNACQ